MGFSSNTEGGNGTDKINLVGREETREESNESLSEYSNETENETESETESEPENTTENIDCHFATVRMASLNACNQKFLDKNLTGPLLRGKIEMYGEKNTVHALALFDSGTSSSLVTSKVLRCAGRKFDWNKKVSENNLTGVLGGNSKVIGDIMIKVKIGEIVFKEHKFLIIESASEEEYDVYLGSDFMKRFNLILDMQALEIKYTPDHRKIEYNIDLNWDDIIVNSVPGENYDEEESNFEFGLGTLSLEEEAEYRLASCKVITDLSEIREKASGSTTYTEWSRESLANAVKIGENLTRDQRELVKDMLFENREAFSKGNLDIGLSRLGEYKIKLTSDSAVYDKPRYLNPGTKALVEKEIQDLLQLGIIEPVSSSGTRFNSRIVPVKKTDANGKQAIRLCADFRGLNRIVEPDRWPMKNIQDSIFNLGKCEYFTGLDLIKGYFQLKLHPESRPYTAFTVNNKQYQFTRLVQGLSSSPAAFQREITKMIDNIDLITEEQRENVLSFLDDLLAKGYEFHDHLYTVDKLLKTMIKYNLKIKPSKCSFFVDRIRFLGFICSKEGIEKAPEFFDELRDYEKPNTVKELRRFLGVIGFYRNHVKDFATIVNPLNKWLGKEDKLRLNWDPEMNTAFESIKRAALEDIKLAFPVYGDPARQLILTVDASNYAAGFYLSQEDENGHEKVIAYGSNTFSSCQRNYSATEKELQALRMGVKAFKDFIGQEEIIIRTDHQALIYLMNMSLCNSRMARTLIDLSEFKFTIEYIKGTLNECADGLSRLNKHVDPLDTEQPESPKRDPENLEIIYKAPGGADSLFACLVRVFELKLLCTNESISMKELRTVLADDLRNNAAQFGIELNKESRAKISMAGLQGCQPLMEMLDAFSRRYGTQVYLHYGARFPLIFAFDRGESRKIHLQWKDQCHFNLFKEKSESKFASVKRIFNCDHARNQDCTVRANFGNQSVCALVDTGSSISIVSEEMYKALNSQGMVADEGTTSFVLDAFAGRVYNKNQKVIQASFALGNEVFMAKFIVLSGDFMDHCVILGTNILKQMGWEIDFGKEIITDVHETIICRFEGAPKPQRPAAKLRQNIREVKATVKYVGNSKQPPKFENPETIIDIQDADFIINTVKRCIIENRSLPGYCAKSRRVWRDLLVRDHILINSKTDSVVMPFHFVVGYCVEMHFQHCHIGKLKLLELAKSEVYHPSMDKICEDITISCDKCQRMKYSGVKAKAPMTKVQTNYPGEIVSVDLLNLPANRENFVGVMVGIDHHTKYSIAIPIRSKTGKHIAEIFEDRMMPAFVFKINCICSDQGREFVSGNFNAILDKYGIEHIYSASAYPQGNGSAERFNKSFIQLLHLETTDISFWPDYVTKVLQVYNGTVHSQLKCSPRDFILNQVHATGSNALQSPRIRAYWSKGNRNFRPFSVGDKVLKEIKYVGDRTVYKLMDKYSGPWTVVKIFPNLLTYGLVNDEGQELTTHYNFLRAYKQPPNYLKNHEAYITYQKQEDETPESVVASPSPSPQFGGQCFTFEIPVVPSEESSFMPAFERLEQTVRECIEQSESLTTDNQTPVSQSESFVSAGERANESVRSSSIEFEPVAERRAQSEPDLSRIPIAMNDESSESSGEYNPELRAVGDSERSPTVHLSNMLKDAPQSSGKIENRQQSLRFDLDPSDEVIQSLGVDSRQAPARALRSRGSVSSVPLPNKPLEYKSRGRKRGK